MVVSWGILQESVMSDFARDLGAGASTGFMGAGARRQRTRAGRLPIWLRLVAILSSTSVLWALIFAGLHWLFAP